MKRICILVSASLYLILAQASLAQRLALAELPVDPFPGAELVNSEPVGENVVAYDWILSPVQKIKRDLSIEKLVRTRGKLERMTWVMPSGVLLDEAVSYYQEALERLQEILPVYECRARDCGRSNLWANEIFHESILYGPNENQFYRAASMDREGQQYLLALYIVQRGNRRVYVHMDFLQPIKPVDVDAHAIFLTELTRRGYAILPDIRPGSDGSLSAENQKALTNLASDLGIFHNEAGFIVCHLYAEDSPQTLIQNSTVCAEAAARLMNQQTELNIQPFGAGSLLPRGADSRSRLELVFPRRLGEG